MFLKFPLKLFKFKNLKSVSGKVPSRICQVDPICNLYMESQFGFSHLVYFIV